MFKIIPGNHKYMISLNGEIRCIDSLGCTPVIKDGLVSVIMYDVEKTLDIEWLALIAHFEVNLPEEFRKDFYSIKFLDIDSKVIKSISGKTMVFEKPIYVKDKFRIIPNFTNYAISNDGKVLNISQNTIINSNKKLITKNNYVRMCVNHPDRTRISWELIHRLVALAWVPNDDWYNKSIINHIDGDKTNYNYTNLEWVTYSGNNTHAFKTGLRSDNYECLVRNIYTGEVSKFHSAREASSFMGIDRETKLHFTHKGKLIAKKYEFRYKNDSIPWFYNEAPDADKIKAARFIITVFFPDKSSKRLYSLEDLQKEFSIWNVSGVDNIAGKFKATYPNHDIMIVDKWPVKAIQAFNIAANIITEAPSIREMSRKLNIEFSYIRTALYAGETRVHNGYAFRYKSNKLWDLNFTVNISSPVCIQTTSQITNEITVFKSLREAARILKMDRSVIKRVINTEIVINNLIFKEIVNN